MIMYGGIFFWGGGDYVVRWTYYLVRTTYCIVRTCPKYTTVIMGF